MSAFAIQDEAYRAFDRWRAEHDPDGEMDILDAAVAYSTYAAEHGITKYLDAAQPPGYTQYMGYRP